MDEFGPPNDRRSHTDGKIRGSGTKWTEKNKGLKSPFHLGEGSDAKAFAEAPWALDFFAGSAL
jgi:hypothetical protein